MGFLDFESNKTIAVVSNTQNRVGLFDVLLYDDTCCVLLPTQCPLLNWVRCDARVVEDLCVDTDSSNSIESVQCITKQNGYLQTMEIDVMRLPYMIHVWEELYEYPLYTIDANIRLPWDSTTVFSMRIPMPRLFDVSLPPLPEGAVCPITLEPLADKTVYWTPCLHAFSKELEVALQYNSICPLCRSCCRFTDCVSVNNATNVKC